MEKKELLYLRLKNRISYISKLAGDPSLANEIYLLIDEYLKENIKSNKEVKKLWQRKKKQTS